MKEKAKQNKSVKLANVQGYHSNGTHYVSNETYAFAGFESNKYFTSDRYIKLNLVDNNLVRVDGKPLNGIGLEIETENFSIESSICYAELLTKVVFSHFPNDLFKLQHDGSLDGKSSAECITQIMTKEFVRNNYANFKLMYDTYFKNFGTSCSQTGNCGMHVNISNGMFGRSKDVQYTAIRKLYYFINKNYDLCCDLFYRNRRRTGYCARMSYDKENCKTMDLENCSISHGVCFNLGHVKTGRIEIRLVGGQKNYPCFRNTMESVFFLIDVVKRINWNDIDDLTKVFNGCNQYVYGRLKTYCLENGSIDRETVRKIGETVVREELL